MNPYEELANAIIVLAAKDYMKALKTLKKAPDNGTVLYEKRSIERFFKSDWFGMLTEADGDLLMAKLKKEALK